MTPRCIAIPRRRCPRPAAASSGDIYVCSRHSTMWTMLLIEDRYSPQTRRMLAFARWETVAEGQRLIDRLHARAA
jgi:hypothetical protein